MSAREIDGFEPIQLSQKNGAAKVRSASLHVDLARAFKMETVAEDLRHSISSLALRNVGCDQLQRQVDAPRH